MVCTRNAWRQALLIVIILAIIAGMLGPCSAASAQPAKCRTVDTEKDLAPAGATTMVTVEQAYWCILDHYVKGRYLDNRILLRGAIVSIDKLLKQVNLKFSPPTLVGDRGADWQAFSSALNRLTTGMPALSLISGYLAEFAIEGMTGSLQDDHTGYLPAQFMKPALAQVDDGPTPSLGIITSTFTSTITQAVYITDVFPHGPAAEAGLRAGDTIVSIDGQPAASGGQPTPGWLNVISPASGVHVSLTVRRPSDGLTRTVSLVARTMLAPIVSARVVGSSIAYVKLYVFSRDSAGKVFGALQSMRASIALTGFVLDLRGNPGGDEAQAVRIVSSLVHGVTVGYTVDAINRRTAQATDDTVPLLRIPGAILIDGSSASSSELVAGTVRDFHAARLIGQRSAGALGEALFYGLNDGGGMEITIARVLGPKGEVVDGVGIAPDQMVAISAHDLSVGYDPALNAAVRYLRAVAAVR